MKRTVCIIILIVVMSLSVLAGDIPEQLLNDDAAEIFFGELVSYNRSSEFPYAEVIPTQKIKGDVLLDVNATYQNIEPVGGITPTEGDTYLFAYLNGSGFILETTSTDAKRIQLRGTVGDMWERFEDYLTEREYEKAEKERLVRQNKPEQIGETVTLTEFLGVAKGDAEKVNLHYSPYVTEVDRDEFYAIADKIILTNIENAPMEKTTDGITYSLPKGIFITVNGFGGYAFVSDECTVDKYGMHMSRLPMADYSIKNEDLQALRTLLPEEAQKEFEVKPDNRKYYVVCGLVILALIITVAGILASKKKRSV